MHLMIQELTHDANVRRGENSQNLQEPTDCQYAINALKGVRNHRNNTLIPFKSTLSSALLLAVGPSGGSFIKRDSVNLGGVTKREKDEPDRKSV